MRNFSQRIISQRYIFFPNWQNIYRWGTRKDSFSQLPQLLKCAIHNKRPCRDAPRHVPTRCVSIFYYQYSIAHCQSHTYPADDPEQGECTQGYKHDFGSFTHFHCCFSSFLVINSLYFSATSSMVMPFFFISTKSCGSMFS